MIRGLGGTEKSDHVEFYINDSTVNANAIGMSMGWRKCHEKLELT